MSSGIDYTILEQQLMS